MSLKQQKQQWDKGEGRHCSSSNAVKGNMNANYLNSDRRHSFPAAIIVVYFERWGGNRLFHSIFYCENELLQTYCAEYVSPEGATMVTDSAKPGN